MFVSKVTRMGLRDASEEQWCSDRVDDLVIAELP